VGGDDHRPATRRHDLTIFALDNGQFLVRDFYPKIAARHHDASHAAMIESRLGWLARPRFSNDQRFVFGMLEDGPQLLDIAAHDDEAHIIDTQFDADLDVREVFAVGRAG